MKNEQITMKLRNELADAKVIEAVDMPAMSIQVLTKGEVPNRKVYLSVVAAEQGASVQYIAECTLLEMDRSLGRRSAKLSDSGLCWNCGVAPHMKQARFCMRCGAEFIQ